MKHLTSVPALPEPTARLAYSIADTAHALSLSRSTIYELIDSGDLVRVKHGNRALVTHASMTAFIDRLVAEQHPAPELTVVDPAA